MSMIRISLPGKSDPTPTASRFRRKWLGRRAMISIRQFALMGGASLGCELGVRAWLRVSAAYYQVRRIEDDGVWGGARARGSPWLVEKPGAGGPTRTRPVRHEESAPDTMGRKSGPTPHATSTSMFPDRGRGRCSAPKKERKFGVGFCVVQCLCRQPIGITGYLPL